MVDARKTRQDIVGPPAGVKPRPPLFRALGRDDPPPTIEIGGEEWLLEEVFKHDS